MKYYITQGNLNWADEIDFDGFDLFTEEELNDAKKVFSEGGDYYDKTVTAYLGTNEDEEVSSNDVLDELEDAEEISKTEYDAICKVLGSHFGVTCYGEFIDNAEYLEDEEEEE